MEKYLIAFVAALAISFAATPFIKKLAVRIGAIDVPKDDRRVHDKPIPRLGGLAIYIGFLAVVLTMVPYSTKVLGILAGATLIVILGVVDDIKPLPSKLKLLVQIVAAVILAASGVRVEWVTNPFDSVDGMAYLSYFSYPITIFWVVGVTNTLNLIDGLDGLAAGIASIAALTLLAVSIMNGHTTVVIYTAALAGAAIGFLPYNFNPAKIFMGDTGSTFLGFVLAAVSIEGAIKGAATLAIAIPILALGLPIFDTAFAIIRRAVNGKPIMEADKGHLHHRLLALGLSQKQVVFTLYAISAFLGLGAIVITQDNPVKSVAVVGFVIATMVLALGQMGFHESEHKRKLDQ
ncbi:MAG: MraY family glycosyltransferase [Bacillota bacterium]|jgi:UDP-GlcNAc:undecaprenyl-phosphate GlcNAc-1-phosphate transferase|nr:MraY family glycosyltransferase [Bacillota bacterium]MDD3298336.1 MraY family glycosyltransferase [Bacillota bacterium]MDD3850561.1 MraY family glycosyltransferase [Bacillota bacterium]MDD4707334.1 MraY family glycosyltransferase [Bacillota bacterium]